MEPNDSYTPTEHGSTVESASLLNQGMDDLEFEEETSRINFCFKTIGLQECMEVLGGGIGLQECTRGKSPVRNNIVMNQHVGECSRLSFIRRGWMILDNLSTFNIFCDGMLIKNSRQVSGRMNIHCNEGIESINWVGDLKGFGTV